MPALLFLSLVPYLDQFSIEEYIRVENTKFGTCLHYSWCKFSITIKLIDAGTAFYGAIWDEFSKQHHQHQSIEKGTLCITQFAFFWYK